MGGTSEFEFNPTDIIGGCQSESSSRQDQNYFLFKGANLNMSKYSNAQTIMPDSNMLKLHESKIAKLTNQNTDLQDQLVEVQQSLQIHK